MNILSAKAIKLQLDGRSILKGVDLDLPNGGFQLIIGPNGAGKSCLLKCLLGLHPYSGEVRIAGQPVNQLSAKQRAKTVGYVPQTLDLQFNLDVTSFLTLSRYAYDDETPTQRDAILAEVQKATETEHLADAYLDQLSGGERQRVLIAAALAQKPRLLILDEPTTAMDPGHRRDLVHLLERLHRTEELSILVVTHDWNEFLHLSPQILALKAGTVAFECESSQLRDHLNDLFGCRFQHFAQNDHWISFPEYRS